MKELKYAILSHTWETWETGGEVILEDIIYSTEHRKSKTSLDKIRKARSLAAVEGYQYIWIDSCCIDKRNSAEESESINSMFAWYNDADICYAFLVGAPNRLDTSTSRTAFRNVKWLKRGWTLQEMLAPSNMKFYAGDWTPLGTKEALSVLLAEATGVDMEILTKDRPLDSASIARRMSWAASRETTRPEDMAYCLMGIFSVNMPMLYGEGEEKAFLRLQEEIMKQSDDQSLFGWVDPTAAPDALHGLLATSPSMFLSSHSILPYEDWEPRTPYAMTNRGLRIDLHLSARENNIYVAAIDCPSPPKYEDSSFLAIYLEKLSNNDQRYGRVRAGELAKISRRGPIETVYVRQKPLRLSDQGVFPEHVLQLRTIPSPERYRIVRVLEKPQTHIIPSIPTTATATPMASRWPTTFFISKGAGQLTTVIMFERVTDGDRLAVFFGSLRAFELAFDVREMDAARDLTHISFKDMQDEFEPSTTERFEREHHSIRISATPVVKSSSKYYLIDIGIESIKRSSRLPELAKSPNNNKNQKKPPVWKRLVA
ncbi:HET-domain-containing protein [Xylariaceae sp. FL1651]|nr:HET-domain-containing protein [Xylariaceae sp. FL1651]